ncbi:hypothetical protein [Methanospirillum lacunae]
MITFYVWLEGTKMRKLLWLMLKEEWRLHSTMFGSLSFALFPIMVGGIAFMGSFLLPFIRKTLPPGNLSLILHSNYLLLGFMVGAFGLLGNEAMNRRFGQASLIAYSARTLPVSDRAIFATFVLKDLLYYFVLWVFPFSLGFLLASPFIGIPLDLPLLLSLTLIISFLSGLSLVFFLSSLYSRSHKGLLIIIGILILGLAGYSIATGDNPAKLFPPIILFQDFSLSLLVESLIGIGIFSTAGILLFTPENIGASRQYKDQIISLSRLLSRFPTPALSAKDLIDLYRSGSAIGQTLFSFLIPLLVIWFFLSLTNDYLPKRNVLFLYAMTTGIIASTMYTWITAFDSYAAYTCLPVSVKTVIISKIASFSVLQVVPAVFLAIICTISGQAIYTVPVIVLALSTSYFTLGLTIWLAGLSPNVLVYDVKVMARYFTIIGIVTTIFSSIAFANPWASLSSIILAVPAWYLIQIGCRKWEEHEQPMY